MNEHESFIRQAYELANPCQEIFERGNRETAVIGPVLEEEGLEIHKQYWLGKQESRNKLFAQLARL